ncbi:unnamed protein product [Anisakis simplex]|uniref:Carboxylic ester hydrolase n=1 Tax=Anisakis simplex TaxID=6269 RepID=A0A0M3JSA5_ANISI|nr:unnamed protein product [Anisakis simplex]
MKFIVTVLFFLPICMHYCAEGHKFTRIVETKLGNVNGFRMNIGSDQKPLHHGQADVFLDIPYAKLSPAVAEMGPKKSVSVTSEGSANHREPIRAQLNHTDNQQNGNCLAMNIFSPNVQSDEKYPVLLWVHDGNSNGGSTNEWHDLVKDIVSNGVVVVLMQYRLGTLRLSQELPQNLGLPDQAEAIRFIAEHIDKFGGDRKRLMLFGESAGKFGESAGKFGESAGTASVSTNANSSSSQSITS